MKDRELLEMAAKAIGKSGTKWAGSRMGLLKMIDPKRPSETGSVGAAWNPLEDNDDALSLAISLRLSIDHNHPADNQPWVAADRNGCEGCYSPVSCVEDEFDEGQRPSATRRAIVRAAAEIGKQMR